MPYSADAMKVIFLDIDGVLIPYGQDARNLNPECTGHLQQIVQATDARLVISSSWRLALYSELLNMLSDYGLANRVIGCTPHRVAAPENAGADWLDHMRAHEITAWLAENRVKYGITHYLCLDDDRTFPHAQMRTIYNRGLEKSHVNRAIALLNGVVAPPV